MIFLNIFLLFLMFSSKITRSWSYKSLTKLAMSTTKTTGYQFIDCGKLRRLERFGDILVSRTCPTATNKPHPSCELFWEQSDLRFEKKQDDKIVEWRGDSVLKCTTNNKWQCSFGTHQIFNLLCSAQGQIGVFPEQLSNWEWIKQKLHAYNLQYTKSNNHTNMISIKVLNGFAYTGGSTLAAHSVGNVQVTHLDASKSFNLWAARNIATSYQNTNIPINVKYITDDCLTFIHREIKRGNKYDMLIFDPPAFGRFDGKIWKLDNDLELLINTFPSLLSNTPCGIVLSCHDIKWPKQRLGELLLNRMKNYGGSVEVGDSILKTEIGGISSSINKLHMGCYARWLPL